MCSRTGRCEVHWNKSSSRRRHQQHRRHRCRRQEQEQQDLRIARPETVVVSWSNSAFARCHQCCSKCGRSRCPL